MGIFSQDWWYEQMQGPFWTWKPLWSTLGIYTFGMSAFFVLIAFSNPGFSITGVILTILSAIFLAITKEPWKFLKPVLLVDVITMIIYLVLPGLVTLIIIVAVPASFFTGIGYGVYRIIKHFKWLRKYRRSLRPMYTVHHVMRRY